MKLSCGIGVIASALLALVTSGCADATAPRGSAAKCPPSCPAPTMQATPSGALAQSLVQVSTLDGTRIYDPNRISLVLEDARLASVRSLVDQEAYGKAVQELSTALTATPTPSPEDARAWLYQLGRLRVLAGDPTGAVKAFDAAAAAGGPLADYARFAAADLLAQVNDADGALTRANQISPGLPIASRLELVMASALAQKGDIDQAATQWRSYLGRSWHPPQWVSTTLKFARALLSHPSEEHAEEAARLAQRVRYESAGGAGADEAKELMAKALATLPFAKRKPFESPGPDDLLSRARALVSSGQSKQGLKAAETVTGSPEAAKPSAFACDAMTLRAEALSGLRRKPEAADAYNAAIERCAGIPRRVEVLYNAGRASLRAERPVEAVQRFAMLEKEFPQHRLADDARYLGARAMLRQADREAFTKMLAAMPDDYPAGDMVADGLFELALVEMEEGNWEKAIAPLERALERFPRERAYFSAGRLPYYLGRSHGEMGNANKAMEYFVRTIREYPLSFYMSLARARLAQIDPTKAQQVADDVLNSEPNETFVVPYHAVFDEPGFVRAVELVRQGEIQLAREELDSLGFGSRKAPEQLLWAAAFLFDRAGASTQSHAIFRTAMNTEKPDRIEIRDWLDHYPAGRWRAAWELAFPRPFATVVTAEAQRNGISEALAFAIMREESAFDPRVTSPAQAVGLMQLIVPTAKRMATPLGLPWDVEALKRPEVNISLGCRYLSQLRKQFAHNQMLAIPGYNAGGGAPKKWADERPTQSFDLWVERIPYEETRFYTKRVMTSLAAYEFLYAGNQPTEAFSVSFSVTSSAHSSP